GTAQELADDLNRYVLDMPISARRPSIVQKVKKWSRRHRPAVTTAAGVGVATLAISAVLLWHEQGRTEAARRDAVANLKQAQANLALAQRNERRATENEQRADANYQKARDVVDKMLTRVGTEMVKIPIKEQVRRDVLQEALDFYKTSLNAVGTDAAARAETALACARMGGTYYQLRDLGNSEEAARKAIALQETLVDEFPSQPKYWADLAEFYWGLWVTLGELGRWKSESGERDRVISRATDICERLVAEFPNEAQYQRRLVFFYTQLASEKAATEQAQIYRNVLERLAKLKSQFPREDSRGIDKTGQSYPVPFPFDDMREIESIAQRGLANLLNKGQVGASRDDSRQESQERIRRALALLRELAREHPDDWAQRAYLVDCTVDLAAWLASVQRHEDAEAAYREAIALHNQIREDFTLPYLTNQLAGIYGGLGRLLRSTGRKDEAHQRFADALKLRTKLVHEAPRQAEFRIALVKLLQDQAGLATELGRADEAETYYRECIEVAAQLAAEFSHFWYRNQVFNSYAEMRVLLRSKNSPEQLRERIKAKDESAAKFADKPIELVHLAQEHLGLAEKLKELGQYEEAIAEARQAVRLFQKVADEHPELHWNQEMLAWACVGGLGEGLKAAGDLAGAAEAFRKSADLFGRLAKALGDSDDRMFQANALSSLAEALTHTGQGHEAVEIGREAVEIFRRLVKDQRGLYPSANSQVRETFVPLADALLNDGRIAEAEAVYQEALQLCTTVARERPEDAGYMEEPALAQANLAAFFSRSGRPEEARKAYEKALEQAPNNPDVLVGYADFLNHSSDPKFRDPTKAIELAKKAAELRPGNLWYERWLGVAQYRAGNFKEAAASLQSAWQSAREPTTNFFLAMAHWQLGNQDAARQWFDRAVEWMAKNPRSKVITQEVLRFRAECEALMGLDETPVPEFEAEGDSRQPVDSRQRAAGRGAAGRGAGGRGQQAGGRSSGPLRAQSIQRK
ncbi:MAG: tetratricopeptide repeat protein, partial [Planctomycetes bacterium]|nr:tetratricopeptide repeat protein [Planctomycetota bacterium]